MSDYILEYGIKSVFIVLEIVLLIVLYIKRKKASTNEENIKQDAQMRDTFWTIAMECIADAEKFKNYTGEERQNYVLTRLQKINQTIYSEEQIVKIVDMLVDLTNKVNVHKKNKGGK